MNSLGRDGRLLCICNLIANRAPAEASLLIPLSPGVVAESYEAGKGGRGWSEARAKPRGFLRGLSPTPATLFKGNNLLPHPLSPVARHLSAISRNNIRFEFRIRASQPSSDCRNPPAMPKHPAAPDDSQNQPMSDAEVTTQFCKTER